MPEFLMFIADDEEARSKLPEEAFAASYAKVGAWWEEHERAGRFAPGAGRRLQRGHAAKTVRVDDGDSAVTDGPFAETKELIGCCGILTVASMDEAVAIAKTWPGLPVTLEIRPVLS